MVPDNPKKCWECKQAVPADAQYCYQCGARLPHLQCPGCGKNVEKGDVFCVACGTRLVEPQPEHESGSLSQPTTSWAETATARPPGRGHESRAIRHRGAGPYPLLVVGFLAALYLTFGWSQYPPATSSGGLLSIYGRYWMDKYNVGRLQYAALWPMYLARQSEDMEDFKSTSQGSMGATPAGVRHRTSPNERQHSSSQPPSSGSSGPTGGSQVPPRYEEVPCPDCGGSGRVNCVYCGGTHHLAIGYKCTGGCPILRPMDYGACPTCGKPMYREIVMCPHCDMNGRSECDKCKGTGRVVKDNY